MFVDSAEPFGCLSALILSGRIHKIDGMRFNDPILSFHHA